MLDWKSKECTVPRHALTVSLSLVFLLLPQVPEKLAAHLYETAHNNPKGYIQRDAVSCRKDHRSSPIAHFAPGFDEDGMPISRTGYMHQCAKHSDCLACGRHPITSQQYKCQKRYILYDTVMTDEENNLEFLNLTSGSASAFDPDLEDGARTGKTGICVDIDSSYNELCSNRGAAFVKDAAAGCMDDYVGAYLCGLSLDVSHGDLSTVSLSGNLFWPRVLVEGSDDEDGDGKSPGRVTCSDPVDCPSKCRMLDRTSRNGAGSPPTCALCKRHVLNMLLFDSWEFSSHTRFDCDVVHCRQPVLSFQCGEHDQRPADCHLGRLVRSHPPDRHLLWLQGGKPRTSQLHRK